LLTIGIALGLALVDLTIVRAHLPLAGSLLPARLAAPADAVAGPPADLPIADALATARPHATLARVVLKSEPRAAAPGDPRAQTIRLSALPPVLAQAVTSRLLLDLPWRPARLAGADRAVPRPPTR
jgi:hypothetical protein